MLTHVAASPETPEPTTATFMLQGIRCELQGKEEEFVGMMETLLLYTYDCERPS